jgi:NTE family protein
MDGIAEAIAQKQLHAVAVTAFGYESGQAVTFYQGGGTIDPGCAIGGSACPRN